MPEALVREHLASAEENLSGWAEAAGYLVPSEPDPELRERTRVELRAVIFAYQRVLEEEPGRAA